MWFRASRTLLSSLGMVRVPLGCSGSGGDGQWFPGADDLDRDVGDEAAGCLDEVGGVLVALEEEHVAHGAAGEGVVLRYRQLGAQGGGELGGLFGVHDDLLVACHSDVQAVDGEQ